MATCNDRRGINEYDTFNTSRPLKMDRFYPTASSIQLEGYCRSTSAGHPIGPVDEFSPFKGPWKYRDQQLGKVMVICAFFPVWKLINYWISLETNSKFSPLSAVWSTSAGKPLMMLVTSEIYLANISSLIGRLQNGYGIVLPCWRYTSANSPAGQKADYHQTSDKGRTISWNLNVSRIVF